MSISRMLLLEYHNNETGLFVNHRVTPIEGQVLGFDEDGKPVMVSLGIYATVTLLENHTDDTNNPHGVTKAQVGLSNVTNDAQLRAAQLGAVSGVCPLGSDQKIPSIYIPPIIGAEGAYRYSGTWNANTNRINPGDVVLPAAAEENKGYCYKVSVAGNTTIDGVSEWAVGDYVCSNGVTWDKQDNSEHPTLVSIQTNVAVSGLTSINFAAYATVIVAGFQATTAKVTGVLNVGEVKAAADVAVAMKITGQNDANIAGGGVGATVQIQRGVGTNAALADALRVTSNDGSTRYMNITSAGSLVGNGSNFIQDYATIRIGSTVIVGVSTRQLFDSSSVVSMNFGSRVLYDAAGEPAINFAGRLLQDPTAQVSLDFSGRETLDEGGTVSIMWHERKLVDGSGVVRMDWNDGFIYFSTGSVVWDIENGIIYDQSEVISVRTGTRVLIGSNGVSSLDWEGRLLFDDGGTAHAGWNGQGFFLRNTATSTRMSLQNKALGGDGLIEIRNPGQMVVANTQTTFQPGYSSADGFTGGKTVIYDGSVNDVVLGNPKVWARINLDGLDYVMPLYPPQT